MNGPSIDDPKPALPSGYVLFVDDEPELTSGLRVSLRKQPWKTLTANSPSEAFEILATSPVDIVVSDQSMPGMRGADFLALVRNRYPETVRLMLTGDSDLEGAVDAVNRAEVFRFLRKPCRPDQLVANLQEAFDVVEARRTATRNRIERGTIKERGDGQFNCAMGSAWMAFQAVVDPRESRTVAFESLLRLDDPDISNPGKLLHLAESIDRVSEVEAFVRRAVAGEIHKAPEDVFLLVNVHPVTLEEDNLAQLFEPLAPFASRVVLEITERDALADTVELQDKLEALRDRGFRIAVDDLGAGYSGLTSFVLLKPDIVKFDMELIRGIDRDPTRGKLVGALCSLCRDMGINTIAEGVETQGELNRVVELGADWVQGFVYSRPGRGFVDPF